MIRKPVELLALLKRLRWFLSGLAVGLTQPEDLRSKRGIRPAKELVLGVLGE